jgi:hypothetical protein
LQHPTIYSYFQNLSFQKKCEQTPGNYGFVNIYGFALVIWKVARKIKVRGQEICSQTAQKITDECIVNSVTGEKIYSGTTGPVY